ncbi:unnamed protein product, partial [Tilletia caries]
SLTAQLKRETDRTASLEATTAELSNSVTNPTAALSKFQNSSSTNSVPNAGDSLAGNRDASQGVDMTMNPTMPLESFTSPELMMWTLADAQKLHTNRKFGKEEVTRDMDGNPIDKELVNEIETAVSIACSELDDIVLPEWLKNKPRNYDLYRANYLRRLIVICQGLEKRFPVLSWCTMHYKALFWIQKHLKSKCESVATAKRKAESLKRSRVGDDSDIDNEAIAKNGAARPSPRKKQNAPATTSRTSKNVGKGKQKAKEKSGKESDNSMTSEEDNGDDDEESDEEGDKTNATRFQSNVRSLFSGKSSTTAQNSAHVGASVGSST